MATTEGKPETKQESKSAEPKQESNSKDVEEIQEPALKYKAWVLKVSIHCEGCKRKVEKILRRIDDHSANQNLDTCVYEVDADLKQQKVTVKANLHVNVDTLIKKIVKKGRHAELWPEKSEKKGKSKNKDKQGGQPNSEEGNHGDDKDKEAAKTEDGASKSGENGGDGCNGGQAPEPEKKGGGGESEGNATTTLLMLDLHLQDRISLVMDLMVLFPSPPPCHLQPIIALHGITTWMNTQRITMHHHRCMLLATTQLILVVAIANRITPHHDRIHICICTRDTCLNTPLSTLIHRIRHNHPIHSRFSAMKTRMHVRLCDECFGIIRNEAYTTCISVLWG